MRCQKKTVKHLKRIAPTRGGKGPKSAVSPSHSADRPTSGITQQQQLVWESGSHYSYEIIKTCQLSLELFLQATAVIFCMSAPNPAALCSILLFYADLNNTWHFTRVLLEQFHLSALKGNIY